MRCVRPSTRPRVSLGTRTPPWWRMWRSVSKYTKRFVKMFPQMVTARSRARFAEKSLSTTVRSCQKQFTKSCPTRPVSGSHSRPVLRTTASLCPGLPSVTTRLWILVLTRWVASLVNNNINCNSSISARGGLRPPTPEDVQAGLQTGS